MNGLAVRAWGFSLLAHGFAVAAATWLVSEIGPVVPNKPFRWEVAFVEPPAPEPAQPVEPSQARPQPPATPPQRTTKTIEAPLPQVTEVRPIETSVIETRPVQEAVQPQTVTTVQRAIETPVTRATSPTSEVKSAPHTEKVVTQSEAVATERAIVSQENAVGAAAAPAAVEREKVQQIIAQSPVEHAPAIAPPAPEVSRPAERMVAAMPPRPSPPETLPVQTPSIVTVPVHATPATRADFGWLKDLLARRIKEVKRYPHTARLNHWEGKVVVHAVIREDGNLADLRIHESSGHEVLDEDALETMRKACPLHMIHPLGRPQMAIRIPINYSLND